MDLRKYTQKKPDQEKMMSLWWYQPYIFSNDLICGVAPSWFIKGIEETIMDRETVGSRFNKCWNINQRMINMYEDWTDALVEYSNLSLKESSVFELACNTGWFLMNLKERGALKCVGIDKKSLDKQRAILRNFSGIDGIDFRNGHWSPYDNHSIIGLEESEQFDITVCTSFLEHMSDPLNLINELSKRTRKALLLSAHIRDRLRVFNYGMNITYRPMSHHVKWGDTFPYGFDTTVSKKLLFYSLKQCGFNEIIEVKYKKNWLPFRWCSRYCTVVCLK